MGMAASSLRFAQLTARKNQVEFEGQQINQQRLTLSQKSSAIYNDMLTKQVPTAPDPSAFTKIVYKFNNGFGTSSILNLARKTSGAYNYNVTYKRPKTTQTLSKSSFSNVGFTSHIGVTTTKDKNVESYYARTANINGVARNLSLVGGNSAAGKLAAYRSKLETYKNMKTIEEQISSLSSKKATDTVSTSTQQNIKSALGLDISDRTGNNAISKALVNVADRKNLTADNINHMTEPTGYNASYMSEATIPSSFQQIDLNNFGNIDDRMQNKRKAAYIMALMLQGGEAVQGNNYFNSNINQQYNNALEYVLKGDKASYNIKNALMYDGPGSVNVFASNPENFSDVSGNSTLKNLNDLQKKELANLLSEYANEDRLDGIEDNEQVTDSQHEDYKNQSENYETYKQHKSEWDDYTNYQKDKVAYETERASESLINIVNGGPANENVTNEQMINMLKELLKETSKADGKAAYNSSGEYKKGEVDPAFTQYQASVAIPGIQNISEGQMLYTYQDDNGETCYMYVSIDNILDDGSSTYADSVSIYENVLNYLDGEYETEQQDANVIMSEDGQVAKITFADGTVVTPEIVTEMDNDAYDQAMVEYEYKKEVYDKEMNDANAKVKIIQAQDQKLEVRLKQLDTEQKALQTEIDAVKSIRDKSIESSFKTFS